MYFCKKKLVMTNSLLSICARTHTPLETNECKTVTSQLRIDRCLWFIQICFLLLAIGWHTTVTTAFSFFNQKFPLNASDLLSFHGCKQAKKKIKEHYVQEKKWEKWHERIANCNSISISMLFIILYYAHPTRTAPIKVYLTWLYQKSKKSKRLK